MSKLMCFAMSAGACGASAAVAGKYAFGIFTLHEDPMLFVAFTAAFICLNILMWWTYTHSLSLSESTILPMVLNMGTNFILSGILGTLLFEEPHSLIWWVGLLVVLSGICIIAYDSSSKVDKVD